MIEDPDRPDPNAPVDEKARARRNVAIALGLVAFAAIVMLVTMVRLMQNIQAN